jgi:hypothetical protein
MHTHPFSTVQYIDMKVMQGLPAMVNPLASNQIVTCQSGWNLAET